MKEFQKRNLKKGMRVVIKDDADHPYYLDYEQGVGGVLRNDKGTFYPLDMFEENLLDDDMILRVHESRYLHGENEREVMMPNIKKGVE